MSNVAETKITSCKPGEDSRGNLWNEASVGQTLVKTCPAGFSGIIITIEIDVLIRKKT